MRMFDVKLQAFTKTTAAFVQPASAASVEVDVDSSVWMPIGSAVFCETGGVYTVAARPDDSTATLTNTGAVGNATPGTPIKAGSLVAPSGHPAASSSGPSGLAVVGSIANNVHYEAVSQGNGDLVVWYIAANLTGNINAILDDPPSGTTAKIKARFAYAGSHGGGISTHAVSIFDHTSGFFPVGGGNNSILEGQIYSGHYTWIDFEWFDDGSGYKWHSTASFQNP